MKFRIWDYSFVIEGRQVVLSWIPQSPFQETLRRELANKVLTDNLKPMSVSEIWDDALDRGYVDLLSTNGKTPKQTLYSRLYAVANDPDNEGFNFIGARPKRFYIPEITPSKALDINEEEILTKEEQSIKLKYKEKDLHQVLACYIRNVLEAFPKTINHSRSNERNTLNGNTLIWSPAIYHCIIGNPKFMISVR